MTGSLDAWTLGSLEDINKICEGFWDLAGGPWCLVLEGVMYVLGYDIE